MGKLDYEPRKDDAEGNAGDRSFIREFASEFAWHLVGLVIFVIVGLLTWLIFHLLRARA